MKKSNALVSVFSHDASLFSTTIEGATTVSQSVRHLADDKQQEVRNTSERFVDSYIYGSDGPAAVVVVLLPLYHMITNKTGLEPDYRPRQTR